MLCLYFLLFRKWAKFSGNLCIISWTSLANEPETDTCWVDCCSEAEWKYQTLLCIFVMAHVNKVSTCIHIAIPGKFSINMMPSYIKISKATLQERVCSYIWLPPSCCNDSRLRCYQPEMPTTLASSQFGIHEWIRVWIKLFNLKSPMLGREGKQIASLLCNKSIPLSYCTERSGCIFIIYPLCIFGFFISYFFL